MRKNVGLLDSLNDCQREAVITTEGPLLVLAGAGSGKTRVLVHRIAYLIEECGVSPWNILAITFTNKAAGEMRKRVDAMVGEGADGVWVSTFHSMCVRILRRHIDLIGFDNSFTIYDADDQKTVVKAIMKKLNIDTKEIKERTIIGAISSAKDELVDPEEYAVNAGGNYKQEIIANVYTEYQNTLHKNNALDFDDLIVKTIELFKACPEVLNNYQERFRYISVDEYQDTNTAQFELVRLLAGKYRNLCVVGDDDQSIYKFRGANIGNILDFEKIFKEAKVVKLEQNYRSTQNILDAANAVIANNTSRKSKSLWTSSGAGNRIHLRQMETAYEEAEYIASDIAKSVRSGEYDYKDCAVLYRTNAQSRILEEAFLRFNIPYNIVGGVNFYARREIKDILAYLKTIDNAVDDVAVLRIINVPKRGIGQTTIGKVVSYAELRGISFFDALCEAETIPGIGKAALKIKVFTDLIDSLRQASEYLPIKDLIDTVVKQTEYFDYLSGEDDDADDRIQNVEELMSKAADYEEKADEVSLSAFLAEVALVADIDNVDEEVSRSLLMTLHGAKGLEFKHVYLAGLEDGLFPSMSAIYDEDPTAIEEERRLAYVGITRAREELTITYAKQRMVRGETQYSAVSRFVQEIPEELMDNRLPKKRVSFDDYPGGGYKSDFGGSGFGFGGSMSGFGSSGAGFGAMSGFGSSGADMGGYGKSASDSLFSKPRAKLKPSVTPVSKKPYIARTLPKANMSGDATLGYGIGDRVKHVKYGIGTVKEISKEPRDYKVTVEFDACGQKIMYAAFAKLEKV